MTTSTSFAQMANKQSISLSSALRANTPPTKGQTTSRKFLTFSIFFLLSFFCTTSAWGATETITLNQSALGLTGSYTTNTQKTIGGVTFVYSNLMKNNDNIQVQANGGEIYNSTAIPGNITKITVTHSGTARSTTVCYGTSAEPTENSTVFSGSKEITVSGSNSFFKITRGSNAAYWTQIVITYETSNSGDGEDSGDTSCLTLSATSNYPFNSTSSSNTNVYSTTIDGITFENKGGYKYNSYLSFNKSLSGAYIANTTPFNGNIESIVVDYNSGGSSYFNMYEGSASKPSSTVVSPSKTGTGSVTYTFSGNNPYFNLALKTTGTYCNINSITICYSNTPTPSHTVTATSNNNTYGTVSVNGTTITAEPADCYQVISGTGGYAIISGTATVTHKGNSNTLTVNASTDCSIRVNFEKKPVNTYIDNVQDYEEQELCGNHSAPSLTDKEPATTGTCEQQHWHFMGWVTEANKENPTDANIVKANTSVTANGTTYYAVWAIGENIGSGTASWSKVTSTSDLEAGATYAISSAATEGNYLSTYTGANNFPKSTTTICKLVLGGSEGAWTFKINDASSYNNYYLTATSTTSSNYLKATSTIDNYCKFSISFNSGKAIITCTGKNSRNVLQYNSGNNPPIFACYASGNQSAVYLQKYSTGSTTTYSDYITTCTTETSPSLNVSREQLNFEAITVGQSTDMSTVLNGTNLKGNANLTITGKNSGMFSVSPSPVTPTDGSITNATILVTYEPTQAGNHTATLTISSQDAEDVTVTLNGSATAPAAEVVNWSVKGVEHTTEFNGQSTTIYQPTGEELTCGEKKFVGWTANSNYENATNAPTDLFTTTLPNGLTSGTTFYAVYADTRTTTSITYTWDLVQQSTTPALAVGDQIVITAKNDNYAISTTQNTDNRGAVSVTKDDDKITIDNKVQIFTLENGNEEGTFALATGNGYLSGTRRKAGKNYYNQLITSPSKSANTSWYIGFTDETTPYIYNEVSEKVGKKYEYPNYYVRFANSSFNVLRDVSWSGQDPKNISIYRKTQNITTTTVNSGYTTDCGCSEPQTPLSINDAEVVVNTELDLAEIYYTGGTGGRIYEYYCSDAAHTTIANGHIFSANALGTYTITATQEANNGACETTATFTITVTCATPSISITPPTYETTINTPVDLKSIIKSTSPMPLTFACTDENVYISGTNFTFLAVGDYTITATQEAGGIYCVGSQEITITVSDPCEDKTKPDVTESAITTDGFTLSWLPIAGVSTYRIYNNTTGDSDETSYTSYTFSGLNPSAEYSWTVEAVYSADGCTAATSGTTTTSTPVVTYTVNWNVAGSSYGSSTTVNHGDKVSNLPTDPKPAEHSCGDKVFVGWSKSQFVDGTRPTDLFTTIAGSPAITAATTFYAVFADCVTDGGDDTPEDDTQGEWTLVTDISVLKAGTKIFIAAAEDNLSLSTTQNNNNRGVAPITKSGNTATIDEETQVLTLEAGTKSGTWAFNTGDGYLYAASSGSNYLRTQTELDDNGSWSISVTNTGIATIKAQGSNTRNWLRKNSTSALFSCYSSGQDNVVIYYKSAESTPVDPTEYTVTLSVLGNTSTATTTGEYTLPSTVSGTCAGKTFVGWTTTENLSSSTEPISNYWAKGTMVTITEDKTYYAVFATESTGGGEGVEQTITLTADNLGLENSGYAEVNPTISGFDFLIDKGYKGSVNSKSVIQMKYEKDKNAGLLYNQTAIPNLKSITVNVAQGGNAFEIYEDESFDINDYGTLLAESTGTTTQNFSSGSQYFTISVYNVVYFSSIVIKYTSGAGTTYSDYSTTCESGGADPDPDPEPTTYTVKWMVNGSQVHSQTNTVGTAITMPSNPADDAIGNCANKFMGWSTFNLGATTGQGAPSDLFTTSPGNITSNITYYAVFATATTSGGGEASATLAFDNTSKRTTFDTTKQVWTENGITFTVDKSNSTVNVNNSTDINPIRVYGAAKVTIGYTNNITKIVFTCSSSNYATALNTSIDNAGTVSGSDVTVKLDGTSDTYTISSFRDQVRMNSLAVYYATSGGSSNTTYSDYVTTCSTGGGDTGGGDTPDPDPEPEPTGNAYVKVTSSQSDYSGDYLIVYEDGGVAFNGGLETLDATNNTISVTINDNIIEATDATNAAKFTIAKIDGGYSIQSASGKYIGFTKYDNGLTANTSAVYANSISVSDGVASISLTFASGTVTLKYNNASNQNRFRYYKSGQQSIALYKLTSTPASAPARKVAMKKAATMRVEKSEMVTRPVVKAPAALAAQECTSYENYTTICCANPITDLKFAAGANSITLYWNTAAASATATLYKDEECADQVTGATQSGITNGTCAFTGLAKTTTYYAKVTTGDGCTAVLEVSTERPIVSVAEWAATQINIDINTHEPIKVFLENEVTGGNQTGNQATELFFSKYYEATANVKLVAVYNGTTEAINLANYTIKYGKTAWASDYITLKDFGVTKGQIQPGEEIILYTMNASDTRDVDIMKCVNEAYPEGTWVQVTTTNNTGKGSLSFGGDKTIALFNGGTMIDIIGGGTTSKPENSGANIKPAWGDAKGWTCDEGLSIDDGTMIGISTNRCLLVRNNTVTSGANAVNLNTSNFVTLCTEWKGAHVPDDDIDDGVSESCENFAFVGTFDYSDYYVKYEELASSEELPADGRLEDGTYKITTPDLHDLACTNMRISVKSATDGTTLVTQDYKVPIIVDEDISTNNPIYFQYTQRTDVDVKPDLGDKNENVLTPDICAECDIVIRDSKTLTHVEDGQGQFRNMMVYPNAKMDNQAAKPFNLNTLQMQGQNDVVSYAIIKNDGSTIDVGDMVFVKRIDDKYWYNFSLPYDCKVADIIQQNGQSMGKYWVDWGIKEYDGKARQEGGNSAGAGNVGLYWKKVEETATLKAHQGYIIGLFTTEWTNQMKFVYFTPTNTNPYRESGDDAKNTTIDSWYTSKTVAARHRGWNFTGSPYISRFGQSTADQGLNNTSLIMTGYPEPENSDEISYTTYTENVYVTIPSTQGGKYYSHSVASGVELLPFTAYFVQAADVKGSTDTPRTLTYAKGNIALPTSAPARTPAATKQRVLVELLVTAPDGQTDNTGVWVDERYTPEYEIAADLGKMYVAGAKPQLYTLAENGEMMAYHALPDASAMNIPLRLYAPKAGDYTLTLNQRVSRLAGAERVELLYNNAVVANMMLQDYTITANRGTVNGYSLSITRRADVSTAIDNITGTAITVIANDGYISVTDIPTDAQVSVYDMLGRLLATQSANGQTVVNIPAVPQGVYNIVVGNNNGHTTIKTVIK